MEGIFIALPTAASMRQERRCAMPVIALMMAMTSVLFGGFGAAGYAAGFGDCPLILNCLPETALTRAVQWCLVLSLLVSSPIQLYIISESLEPMLVQSAANTPPHQPPPLAVCRCLRSFLSQSVSQSTAAGADVCLRS